ncbi:MAG: MATE family efflux transporter [Deltaproteobacteria bacterium]|nr:MATE family efflux transporter [Deltaproteobacteria bacterium]
MSIEWKDNPLRALGRLAWPITISTLSYSVMTLVDTILVGHVGRAELAGVGLGGIMAFVFLCFSIGLLRGANTLVAQAVGAGRPEEARGYQGAAIVIALVLGVITMGVGQIAAEILRHFAASPAAGEAVRTYLRIRILGAPFMLLFVAFREVRYGRGESRAPMRATVIANLVNIALAYTFIFVFQAGVAGAAYAALIAHAVEAGVLAVPALRSGWGVRTFARRHLRALWRLGAPLGIQFTLEVGSFGLLSLLISGLSDVEMAGHQIALQVIHFSFLPAFAVAEASAVLVGQAVGARRNDLVLRVAHIALAVTGTYTALWTVILVFGSRLIVSGFTVDPAVAATSVALLHVAAVFQVIDAGNLVGRAALRGAGDVRYAAVVGVATSWLCTPPLAWFLGYRMHLGARGGWLGLCLEITVGTSLLWWRLQRRGWTTAATAAAERAAAAPSATAARADDAQAVA